MKHVVWKPFWDFEKEEKWLNEMAAKGFLLTDYSWCRYVFTEGPRGAYTYRIELLDQLPKHPESQDYIRFMEQNGVEHVASYLRWVYFRRRSAEGEFNIYSDITSRIKHYKRVRLLWMTLLLIELLVGAFNISIGLSPLLATGSPNYINLGCGVALLLVALCIWLLVAPIHKKIKKMEQESLIVE